ncbi:MAG: NAD(P)/FAD-dependent oxidoreductase [Gemmatimonadota bacterium]|nr:NAD(P)/FAD-dependent oxidoreductase [Gemmatimonadota bacterium]MDH5804292.1 NAD(P)/FAD-dependent oxidoreductase [Gemmatimonadota bacterium]
MSHSRVVIVGGGFGGLYAAKRLGGLPLDITLIDRRNFHTFQPLLYQVATAGLSPSDITAALRWILRKQRNTTVLLGDVVTIDASQKQIFLSDGKAISYDTLILATGVTHDYFGNDSWEKPAPGLKTIEDATEIRSRILRAFEAAEHAPDNVENEGWLNFVVVGGGPTGVELAGAMSELARQTMRHDFRGINPAATEISLIEAGPRILQAFPPSLSDQAKKSLRALGVSVLTDTRVTEISNHHVRLSSEKGNETLKTKTVVWAAGVRASPLGRDLAKSLGLECDRSGRIPVEPDLTIAGHPEIFVIGDLASFTHKGGKPLPGVAPVAIQQGRYVAKTIKHRVRTGRQNLRKPFVYINKGELATIGRARAVANFRKLRFGGYPAWLIWLFVHLMYLVEFENRVLVFVQWAWNYVTRNRGARIIAHGWKTDRETQV